MIEAQSQARMDKTTKAMSALFVANNLTVAEALATLQLFMANIFERSNGHEVAMKFQQVVEEFCQNETALGKTVN